MASALLKAGLKKTVTGNKNWLHPAEALQKGHIAYLVKFLGSTGVEQPKGFDVVKQAIQKLNFSQQLRKAEGVRIPKVELTISVDGVAIHEPKTKVIIAARLGVMNSILKVIIAARLGVMNSILKVIIAARLGVMNSILKVIIAARLGVMNSILKVIIAARLGVMNSILKVIIGARLGVMNSILKIAATDCVELQQCSFPDHYGERHPQQRPDSDASSLWTPRLTFTEDLFDRTNVTLCVANVAQRLFGAAIDKDQVLRETFDKVQTLQQKNVFLLVDEVQIRPTVSISGGLLSSMAENNRDCKATSILITRRQGTVRVKERQYSDDYYTLNLLSTPQICCQPLRERLAEEYSPSDLCQESPRNLHQYPLHRISYCADDKAEKKFFSFIAKEADSDDHTCFVFVSDKLAEEITLTIGQAFDLAYRRFLETSGRELELRRQVVTLQNKLKVAESENAMLRQQLRNLNGGLKICDTLLCDRALDDWTELGGESSSDPPESSPGSASPPLPSALPPLPPRSATLPLDDLLDDSTLEGDTDDSDFNPRAADDGGDFNPRAADDLGDFNPRAPTNMPPSSPLQLALNGSTGTTNGTLGHTDGDDFDPRAGESKDGRRPAPQSSSPPPLIPPPRPTRPHETQQINQQVDDIFGSVPDPFSSMPSPQNKSFNDDILAQFSEMKAGFSRGLSFGTADQDFTLDSLDPLKN
ncbi:PTB/PI domain [Trinorchestia longiramus]|nr:PTB/PI domain [Trinorchestia longiramus]